MSEAASKSGTRPVPRTLWWLIGLFVALTIAAVFWSIGRFEADLTAAAELALAAEGLDVGVEFDGRDAVLSGTVGADIQVDQAVQIVTEVPGVRTVSGALITVSATSTPTTTVTPTPEIFPAVVEVAVGSGVVTLAGLVSAADRLALITAAEGVFGAAGVEDRLQVGADVATPDWLVSFPEALAELGPLEEGTILVSDQGLEIVGTVTSQAEVERIGIRLAQITKLQVMNQLSFVALGPPTISVIASGGTLTLNGVLPAQDDIDAILAAASAGFGTVEDQLVLGQVTSETWVQLMPALVARMGSWPSWLLDDRRVCPEHGRARCAFGGCA